MQVNAEAHFMPVSLPLWLLGDCNQSQFLQTSHLSHPTWMHTLPLPASVTTFTCVFLSTPVNSTS